VPAPAFELPPDVISLYHCCTTSGETGSNAGQLSDARKALFCKEKSAISTICPEPRILFVVQAVGGSSPLAHPRRKVLLIARFLGFYRTSYTSNGWLGLSRSTEQLPNLRIKM
jgi:hypothetical protein